MRRSYKWSVEREGEQLKSYQRRGPVASIYRTYYSLSHNLFPQLYSHPFNPSLIVTDDKCPLHSLHSRYFYNTSTSIYLHNVHCYNLKRKNRGWTTFSILISFRFFYHKREITTWRETRKRNEEKFLMNS